MDDLLKEIENCQLKIMPESYPISISEIASMYSNWEINIRPEFQRFFRWDKDQKSRLIESIFLWLPLPSFFVSTNEKRDWEVIDWLQRLWTIFEFMWILNKEHLEKINENKKIVDWLSQWSYKYLHFLKWKIWDNISEEWKREFKRYKLNLNILKVSSDKEAKYELFQRLNTWGTSLTPQEVRNCIMIMENKQFYDFIEELSKFEDFKTCIDSITDSEMSGQYDKELIIRFFALRNYKKWDTISSVESFLEWSYRDFMWERDIDRLKAEKEVFYDTFKKLKETQGENIFKRIYDDWKAKRKMLLPMFDILSLRVSRNTNVDIKVLDDAISKIWKDEDFNKKIWVWPSIESKLLYSLKEGQEKLNWLINK